jgi:hypothetical protein
MKEIIIKRWLKKKANLTDSEIEQSLKNFSPLQWISLMNEYSIEMCEIQKILCESRHSSENACLTLLNLFSPDDLRKAEGKYHMGGGILLSKEQFIQNENDKNTPIEEIERRLYANYLPNMIKEQKYYD